MTSLKQNKNKEARTSFSELGGLQARCPIFFVKERHLSREIEGK